jgi:hypothetical protein
MEFATWLNITIAVLILLFFAVMIAVEYLKRMERKLLREWQTLLLLVRKRSDLLPLIIERSAKHLPNFDQNQLTDLRAKAMNISVCSGTKVSNELLLTDLIKKLFKQIAGSSECKRDYLLLAMQKELNKQEELVLEEMEKYNLKVGNFNRYVGIFGFSLIANLFKLSRQRKFEFEG